MEPAGRANRVRGEIEAMINGRRRILCMTLGALAELETAFSVDNIGDLAGRFSGGKIGTRDVMAIIAAGLRGGGNLVEDRDLDDMRVDGGLGGAMTLAARLMSSAFAPEDLPPNP